MNIDNSIKEWSRLVTESFDDFDGENLLGSISGRYRPGMPDDDNDDFLLANLNTKTLKWNVLAVIMNYKTKKIVDADIYTDREFDTLEDAVEYIRERESDDSLEKNIEECGDVGKKNDVAAEPEGEVQG